MYKIGLSEFKTTHCIFENTHLPRVLRHFSQGRARKGTNINIEWFRDLPGYLKKKHFTLFFKLLSWDIRLRLTKQKIIWAPIPETITLLAFLHKKIFLRRKQCIFYKQISWIGVWLIFLKNCDNSEKIRIPSKLDRNLPKTQLAKSE